MIEFGIGDVLANRYGVTLEDLTAIRPSWTTVNPNTVSNFRNAAGLPLQNAGRFESEGILRGTQGVYATTASRIGANMGGLPEVLVPEAQSQIQLLRVSGVNPEF